VGVGMSINILFNASKCGLGNNGGTKTIIRSAETLQGMGHNVVIYTTNNKYSWHKIKVPISFANSWMGSDYHEVVVSVWELQYVSAIMFMETSMRNKVVWWCRGWEKWVKGEKWLIHHAKNFVKKGGRIIVNSSWLIDQFKEKCGIDVELCYAGLDLDVFNMPEVDIGRRVIGFMKYHRHKTKRSDLMFKLNESRNKHGWSTSEINIKSGLSNIDLKKYYKFCSAWFSPTNLEGFHNVAAEANLCGCLVYCNRTESNGMGDYATEETAMRHSTWGEFMEGLKKPDFSKVLKMQNVLKNKIGSREKNMKRFVGLLK
jgi:hypothetical protein